VDAPTGGSRAPSRRPPSSPRPRSTAPSSGWPGCRCAPAAEAASPLDALARARETVEGIGEVAWAGLNPPPETPLQVRVGPHRRLRTVEARLEDFKTVKDAFGGTVNDVVLAVVAGGLRRWLHGRGMRTEGLELRVCVPVSVRTDEDHNAFGNKLVQILCPLPVYVADPIDRLRFVAENMHGLKHSKQALGAEAIASAEDFAPPTILARATRMNFSTRFYNLLVTNVPGPQFGLYVLGRRLERVFPVPFLAGDRALAVAVMSYDGGMNFGLLADYDAMADLDELADRRRGVAGRARVARDGRPAEPPQPRTTKTRERARARRASTRRLSDQTQSASPRRRRRPGARRSDTTSRACSGVPHTAWCGRLAAVLSRAPVGEHAQRPASSRARR
jgi:WS/DGAT/MGAT family acyltransferase